MTALSRSAEGHTGRRVTMPDPDAPFVRARVLNDVADHPGTTAPQVAARLGIKRVVASNALNALMRQRRVWRDRRSGCVYQWAINGVPFDLQRRDVQHGGGTVEAGMRALKVLSAGRHDADALKEFAGQDIVILGAGDLAALRAAGALLYRRVLLAEAPLFPIVITDGLGDEVSINFTFAGEIRAEVFGVGEIAADVFESRAGWKWSARVMLLKWVPRPPERVVEDETGDYVPTSPRTGGGVADSEVAAKDAAGRWIVGQLP